MKSVLRVAPPVFPEGIPLRLLVPRAHLDQACAHQFMLEIRSSKAQPLPIICYIELKSSCAG